MPELPEVETIKNELTPHIVGRCIAGVSLLWDGIVRQPSVGEFCCRLTGQEVTGITRRGKYLIFSLSSGDLLVIHLKMSGSLLLKPVSVELDKFIRAIIYLDKEAGLFFRDPRKLGEMRLVKDGNSIFGKLGPEPLEPSFTPEVLAQRLTRRKAPIKVVLLDQSFVAGLGNMYADEALFFAGIHPLRPASSLSQDETRHLHQAIQQVLRAAIGNKGASVNTYFRPSGEKGSAQFQFRVAHRGGKPCPVCSAPIERVAIRHRGSYFCPHCQPERV